MNLTWLRVDEEIALAEAREAARTIYVITTEDGVDQICHSDAEAKREARDLKRMGCERVRTFVITGARAEEAAYDIDAVLRDGKPFGRKGMRRLAETYGVTVTLR